MTTQRTNSRDLLDAVYDELDFKTSPSFLRPSSVPGQIPKDELIGKYGWLKLAYQLGADRIFFVGNYPMALFFRLDLEEKIHQLHINVWNMSRAPFMFVALPGEIRVYSAYEKTNTGSGRLEERR